MQKEIEIVLACIHGKLAYAEALIQWREARRERGRSDDESKFGMLLASLAE